MFLVKFQTIKKFVLGTNGHSTGYVLRVTNQPEFWWIYRWFKNLLLWKLSVKNKSVQRKKSATEQRARKNAQVKSNASEQLKIQMHRSAICKCLRLWSSSKLIAEFISFVLVLKVSVFSFLQPASAAGSCKQHWCYSWWGRKNSGSTMEWVFDGGQRFDLIFEVVTCPMIEEILLQPISRKWRRRIESDTKTWADGPIKIWHVWWPFRCRKRQRTKRNRRGKERRCRSVPLIITRDPIFMTITELQLLTYFHFKFIFGWPLDCQNFQFFADVAMIWKCFVTCFWFLHESFCTFWTTKSQYSPK